MNQQALAVSEISAFGPFVLDLGARALLSSGEKLVLSSRAFDILALLVRERERVVSKDEILTKVWRGVAVEENNLAVQMSALRRVLAEHAGGQTIILTVPGQGYRFVARLEAPVAEMPVADPLPPAAPATRRSASKWVFAAPAAVAACAVAAWFAMQGLRPAAAPRLSIAVLPFRNLSDDLKQTYLADAISDDLTTDLSHIPGSVVIARESSDVYKGRAVPAEQIGRALRVRYLLEGSLRGADGVFHVNAQLIDAGSGAHLWAEAFDTSRSQLSDTQAAIVRNIASALDVRLVAIESERSRRERQNNPDAFDLYLQARSVADTAQSLEQLSYGQRLFEKALDLQPDYVDAMADLALLLLEKSIEHDNPDDSKDVARAETLIGRTLSLAPNNVQALTARGLEQNLDGRLSESEATLRAALDIDPTNLRALTQLAEDEWRLGKPQAAADILGRILRLDPEGPDANKKIASLGMAYFMIGKLPESIETLLRSLAADPTDSSAGADRVEFSNMFLIAAYDQSGSRDKAQKLYQAYNQHWPHRSIWRLCSYFSMAQAALPGFTALQNGLRDAGMPTFQTPPPAGISSTADVPTGDFEPPPAFIHGASAIAVAALPVALAQTPTPVVLDVGAGAATIKGSVWIPNPNDERGGLDERLVQIPPSRPIILVGNGFYGTAGYSAVTRIVATGRPSVAWLVGGEEALAASGYPTVDRRTP